MAFGQFMRETTLHFISTKKRVEDLDKVAEMTQNTFTLRHQLPRQRTLDPLILSPLGDESRVQRSGL